MAPPLRLRRWFGDQPYLLLVLATLFWGANAVAGRLAIGQVSPMAVVCLRWFFVLAILLVATRGSPAPGWRLLRPHWPRLFLMGALGYTGFNALFYWAAHYTSAVNIGVIQGIIPALVIAGSFLAYGTPLRPVQAAGVVLTIAGVIVTASAGDPDVLLHLAFNVGDLGIAIASVFYAGYTVALRTRPRVAPITFFTAMALFAFLTSLPLLGWEIASGAARWPTPFGWLLVILIAAFPSLVSQLLYIRAVELIGPSRAGLFMNLIPVFAAGLGVVLLGESFAPYQGVALALVLGGIWLAERRS